MSKQRKTERKPPKWLRELARNAGPPVWATHVSPLPSETVRRANRDPEGDHVWEVKRLVTFLDQDRMDAWGLVQANARDIQRLADAVRAAADSLCYATPDPHVKAARSVLAEALVAMDRAEDPDA